MESKMIKLTYRDIYEKCDAIKIESNKKIFGIPKGGLIPAAIIASKNNGILVDTPEESDIIIDDIVDSGATKGLYSKYGKQFISLYSKTDSWIEFPWEINESPAEDSVIRILQAIGEDVKREGLLDTPKRHMKYLKEFLDPKGFNMTTFSSENYDEMITQDNIKFYSLCEHHILPFFGTAKVSYIPKNRIIGLSKLARVVDLFANRLQNQERITTQVAEYLNKELEPRGVGVQLKARHMCMEMRGIKKSDSFTITTKLIGAYKDLPEARKEFLSI